MANEIKRQIAHRLKSIRKQRHLSLDATANLTGVSKAMLGQIEREESSPTISKLWQIATGLEVSFSSFFPKKTVTSDNTYTDQSGMKVRTIFPFQEDTKIEVLDVSLTNNHTQTSLPHSPRVIEHVILLEGELELFFDGNTHLLTEGEQIRFHADQRHAYKALTTFVRFQNIICYPHE